MAGSMLGAMFLIWFLILHSPRTIQAFCSHNPNAPIEWSSAFIALRMYSGSWICARHAQQYHEPSHDRQGQKRVRR
jgi:hypothetical protein